MVCKIYFVCSIYKASKHSPDPYSGVLQMRRRMARLTQKNGRMWMTQATPSRTPQRRSRARVAASTSARAMVNYPPPGSWGYCSMHPLHLHKHVFRGVTCCLFRRTLAHSMFWTGLGVLTGLVQHLMPLAYEFCAPHMATQLSGTCEPIRRARPRLSAPSNEMKSCRICLMQQSPGSR